MHIVNNYKEMHTIKNPIKIHMTHDGKITKSNVSCVPIIMKWTKDKNKD